MKQLPEVLTLVGFVVLAAVPPLWLPAQHAAVESGELTWVVGVVVQNTLLLLGLAYVLRDRGAMRNAMLGRLPPAAQSLPLAAALLAVYALDLALMWWGFADDDPMVLDRAAVVIFSAALLTGVRVALPLGIAAVLLRVLLVLFTDDNGLPAADALSGQWLSDHSWVLLEPGVLFLPAGIAAALLLCRFGCRRGSGCPLWTGFALAVVAESAYLAAAWQQWDQQDWAQYWAAEAFADAFAIGLSITLLLMLLRGLRGDLERARSQATELALARERLQALRAQTHPHFLFNALNTIHSRIAEQPDDARELLLDLSDLLRSVLSERGTHTSLQRELEIVRHYVALEQARFGDRLRIDYQIEPACNALPVPVLVLQPLVENAIKHGIAPHIGGGQVSISAACDGERLRIEVRDRHQADGGGETPVGTGSGLDNIRQRLQLLYQGQARLQFDNHPADGCLVIVELPLQSASDPK